MVSRLVEAGDRDLGHIVATLPSFPLRLSKFRYPKQRVEMGSVSPSSARVVQNIGYCKG